MPDFCQDIFGGITGYCKCKMYPGGILDLTKYQEKHN